MSQIFARAAVGNIPALNDANRDAFREFVEQYVRKRRGKT